MAPCSHHWQKAQSCHFQQESGRDLCQQPSVPLGVALSVIPALLPRDMWNSGCLWSWSHRLPCWKVPGREGSSMPLLRFLLTRTRCLPSAQAGQAHLPPWLSGLRVSPCHHLQDGCCPVSQAGVPLVPVRHREGLSPVTWAQLPASAYQATEGT